MPFFVVQVYSLTCTEKKKTKKKRCFRRSCFSTVGGKYYTTQKEDRSLQIMYRSNFCCHCQW